MTRQRINASRATPPEASLDDLKRIHGIGLTIERRLHSAGICTFADLAALSAETLAALIPTLSAKQITKQGWIPQARKLVTNDAKTSTRAKESVILASRQHYHNFTVEFLLDENNKTRRIRVVHVQSGDVDTWAKWDSERLFDFLARHTGAHLSYGKAALRTAAKPVTPDLSPQPLVSTDPLRRDPQKVSPPSIPASPIDQIRLLEWKTVISKTNQLLHNIPHGQEFDVNLTLDLTSAVLPDTSQLDLTAFLYAKKVGEGHRQVIGETRSVLPCANTVNLSIVNSTLPQGLYRFEVLVTLVPIDSSLPPQSSILTSFQGGLFQVY
jgi:hypothetical protein